jgi:hypothetical protein
VREQCSHQGGKQRIRHLPIFEIKGRDSCKGGGKSEIKRGLTWRGKMRYHASKEIVRKEGQKHERFASCGTRIERRNHAQNALTMCFKPQKSADE